MRALRSLSLLLLTIPFASALTASDPNTVGPYGAVMFTIQPGYNPIGITFVNQHVDAGLIASNTGTVITVSAATNNIGSKLDSTKFYYLEVTGRGDGNPSAYEGDRFELSVATTIASANNTITIDTAFSGNTLAGNLPDLSGCTYVIRPHITLKQLFGTGAEAKLNGTTSQLTADKVHLFPKGAVSFVTYWYRKSATVDAWRQGATPADDQRIQPGEGVLVERVLNESVDIVVAGAIRTNHFSQPLVSGYNFVTQGRPVSISPTNGQMLDTGVGAWSGTTSLSTADLVVFWNGASFGDVYWYRKSATINDWLNINTGTTGRYKDVNFLDHTSSYFIFKQVATNDYFVPNANPEL